MKSDSSQLRVKAQAGLYIIATPIGNLKDITLRALDTLAACDLIVCEDTRVTGKLLAHYGIKKPLLSYNDHNGGERRPKILSELAAGKSVALVSDAGTPLISDPGYKLVREAMERGIYVSALPGASAALAALCLSGLPSDRFFFAGFLPAKKEACRKDIRLLAGIPATLVLFESARRLPETLKLLHEELGERAAAVSREITKLYEETRRGSLQELHEFYQASGAPKGEVVIVIGPPGKKEISAGDIDERLKELLSSHSVKEAAAMLAKETGRPRKEIYQMALQAQHGKKS